MEKKTRWLSYLRSRNSIKILEAYFIRWPTTILEGFRQNSNTNVKLIDLVNYIRQEEAIRKAWKLEQT